MANGIFKEIRIRRKIYEHIIRPVSFYAGYPVLDHKEYGDVTCGNDLQNVVFPKGWSGKTCNELNYLVSESIVFLKVWKSFTFFRILSVDSWDSSAMIAS